MDEEECDSESDSKNPWEKVKNAFSPRKQRWGKTLTFI